MENENFSAPKPDEPLMKNNPAHGGGKAPPVVSVVAEEDEAKKFLPQSDGDTAHYKKDFGEVQIKQQPKFIGLTQEELEKYADDPFWRKLRLALFALFWISWILMFVIAIVLVVTSPKCAPKPHRYWWQKQLCYQAYTRTFKDSDGNGVGDLKGMKEKLNDLKQIQVQTIWPVPIIESQNFTGYDVTNYTAVDGRLGTMQDFEDLVAAAHGLGMKVLIDLPLTTMSTDSEWFKNSVAGTNRNYFHWGQNVVSSPGGTATWERHSSGLWYLASRKWALLNWDTAQVREEMSSVLSTWIGRGVDGFYLGHVQFMGVKDDGRNIDWDLVGDRIEGLVAAVKNETGSDKEIAFFTSLAEGIEKDKAAQLVRKGRLNYIINTELNLVDEMCNGQCLRNHLTTIQEHHEELNATWPVWEIGNPYTDRVATRLGNNRQRAELMQMLLFLLEGSINTYYGDELGLYNVKNSGSIRLLDPKNFVMRSPMQWDNSPNGGFSNASQIQIPVNDDYKTNNFKSLMDARGSNSLELYKKMGEWRANDDTFLYGGMEVSGNGSIVAVKRNAYASSFNYYAILNFANSTETLNLATDLNFSLPGESEPLVAGATSNLAEKYKSRQAVDIGKVTLGPYSGLIIKYK